MSRIGKKPVVIPAGVTVTVENNTVTVKGPKGELSREFSPAMAINVEGNELTVTRPNDEKASRTIHGTTRALIANMVEGVSNGFAKTLDIQGVGYRAQKQGNKIVLNLGYSHPIEYTPEQGIEVEVPTNTQLIVRGISKERVGHVAALIRSYRQPEPYKGKGIRYSDEVVRRKEGKTGK
ncbi:50S ribosomal protein L6 [Exiguobacterium sp. Leaf187]|jgi:large subunit ribosomal protein L6|uniref:Large ribosomal subunit protein uL6 n=1 Tax=Exiguobacterium indicum TaxID=296995 RepID=A0A0V8GBP2_9BACL|nr:MULTISPECIES: 50S ribosomal protein L6 [Exiguobacterium]AHA28461.1 50S ribosomal protein L6 [Exiguobacterium sp. MH3]EZP58265.1 50S ribosomal protein L6 [Exiguobacterium sp. RIT341]KQS20987.1 50S ribosomal protein L6 [Exiguobacterium sp. Leaf187]KQS35542.1 50S ribosomal protein L6 [Exiguobacterium sp. Leaf196]KSU47567.1 50S ribosomal protein L6 [Exiguobacterium enclense]